MVTSDAADVRRRASKFPRRFLPDGCRLYSPGFVVDGKTELCCGTFSLTVLRRRRPELDTIFNFLDVFFLIVTS